VNQRFATSSERETVEVAKSFAVTLQRGDVVALSGELGTGKTRFVKGICEAFHTRHEVTSPSFVILNRYEGVDGRGAELLIYHLDLYRVRSREEIYDIGFEEFFYGNGICLIEWPELLGELLPAGRYEVSLSYGAGADQRDIEIRRVIGDAVRSDSHGRPVQQ
jgi:tRNA threonylcarbamoyladenosine biosynthesis protein TsaE